MNPTEINYWGILCYPNNSVKPQLLPGKFTDRSLAERACDRLKRQVPGTGFQVLSLAESECLPISR